MTESRIDEAIVRIESALLRIERHAAAGAQGADQRGDEALRDVVRRSIAQLDELIAEIEP